MPTTKAMQEVADSFGYQLAFLKSDKELYGVFTKAVNGRWDAARFVAAVRATRWYKNHSETWRQGAQLKYTDPASYKAKIAETQASVKALAQQIGAPVPAADLARLAEHSFLFGWSAEQLRDQVARYTSVKNATGEAGNLLQELKQTAFRNGVNLTDDYLNRVIRRVSLGEITLENAQQAIRTTYGKSVAPGFEKELAAGQDLYDVASPYMQTMAKTLELNPGDIDLFDPTIRKALASSSDKDGQTGSVPLWQFERDLKKDTRWLQTNGARDELDKATRSLAQMFGKAV